MKKYIAKVVEITKKIPGKESEAARKEIEGYHELRNSLISIELLPNCKKKRESDFAIYCTNKGVQLVK
jgi:hypothetical protein